MSKISILTTTLAALMLVPAIQSTAEAQVRRPLNERYQGGKLVPQGLDRPYNPTRSAPGPNLIGDMGIQFNKERQAVIEVADENALAYRAGLRAGDEVLSANGRRFSSNAELNDFLEDLAGEVIPLVVRRNDEKKTILVGLNEHLERLDRGTPPGMLGISFESNELDIYVAHVVANSPAALSGMRVGDEILSLNNERFVRTQELVKAVAALPKDEPANFRVVRRDRVMRLEVDPMQDDAVLVATADDRTATRRLKSRQQANAELVKLRQRTERMEKELAEMRKLLRMKNANAASKQKSAQAATKTAGK